MRRHAEAMGSMDPDFIAADYAEDAVVICNLVEKPAVGRAAIREMIAEVLDMDFMKNSNNKPGTGQGDDYVKDIEAGEYILHIFKNKSAGMNGIETYRVSNDKIDFESAFIEIL